MLRRFRQNTDMAQPDLKLDVAGVNALMARAFPDAALDALPQVTALSPGRAHIVRTYGGGMLRPGG